MKVVDWLMAHLQHNGNRTRLEEAERNVQMATERAEEASRRMEAALRALKAQTTVDALSRRGRR